MNTIDNNPHPPNIVQTGLTGLLGNSSNLLNVPVTAIAETRGEEPVGETVGTATESWGVMSVGVDNGIGASSYPIPEQDSAGRTPVEAAGTADAGN